MTQEIETAAPAPTDADLRTLWQRAGGTIYSASRETASMPTRVLIPFLRQLVGPHQIVLDVPAADMADFMAMAQREQAEPRRLEAAPPAPDTQYAAALMRLIEAVCPGLDTGNLLEDARKATEAMLAGAVLVGHFGIDDEPCTDGSARYMQVGSQHAGDADVFPLFRRAARVVEAATAPAPATSESTAAPAPRAPAAKKAKGAA